MYQVCFCYIQIHLMLLLILFPCVKYHHQYAIQIHLMLLLISIMRTEYAITSHSNTSHVTINHNKKTSKHYTEGIQIHLMLLLILPGRGGMKSCSYHSNTSHVTINRKCYIFSLGWSFGFKYISCYY